MIIIMTLSSPYCAYFENRCVTTHDLTTSQSSKKATSCIDHIKQIYRVTMLLIRQLIEKLLSQGIGDMGDEGMMVIILYAPRPRESGRKTRGGKSNG